MADRVWNGIYPLFFWRSRQLSLNKFFDPSTPSVRKEDDGEKRKEKRENNVVYCGHLRRCQLAARPPTDRSCQYCPPKKVRQLVTGMRYDVEPSVPRIVPNKAEI